MKDFENHTIDFGEADKNPCMNWYQKSIILFIIMTFWHMFTDFLVCTQEIKMLLVFMANMLSAVAVSVFYFIDFYIVK